MLSSILPEPLHPAVVHLPIALVLLLPAFALGALWVIRRGAAPLHAWGLVTALFATLTISAWAATETGEETHEQVERVVAEEPLETHEDAGEAFLTASWVVLGLAAAGLLNGRVGTAARVAATLGSAVLLVMGWRVGQTGGALVYEHGAASAYTAGASGRASAGGAAAAAARDGREREEDEHP